MKRLPFAPLLASALALGFAACRTTPPPAAARVAPPAPLAAVAPALPPEPPLPEGVSISPPLTGDTGVPFAVRIAGERTFPNNLIGANLAFTSNLRMPKLEAASTAEGRFQLRMRFSNASEAPLFVSLLCTYDGDTRAVRAVRRVQFPVNTYRDVVFDLEGDVSRKIQIQATAVPADAPADLAAF